MKKIFISFVVMALSSCVYMQGDYTLGKRNTFNDFFYTYNVRYYDTDAFSSQEIETETVSDYEIGALGRAVPGGIVASSKIVKKEVYSDEFVRPTNKGMLSSYTVPVEFSDEKVYRTIGEVEIKDVTYRLIEPNRIGDIILIDDQGNIYPRVGRMYNGRLALLKTSFILEPAESKFISEVQNRLGEEDVVAGFELRYLGVQNYQMMFSLTNVSPDGEMEIESRKVFKFPMYDKFVSIDGMRLEIINVDQSGIEYKILEI